MISPADMEPSSTPAFHAMDSLKRQIENKRSMLGTTWSELFGIMAKYQAQLVAKHDELQFLSGDSSDGIYQEFEKCKMEKDELQKRVANLESKLLERESEIVQLRTEVHQSKNEMLKKNELIRNLQSQVSGDETSPPAKRRKSQRNQKNQLSIGPPPSNLDPPSTPSSTVTTPDRTVVKQEPEDMPEPSALGQKSFTLDKLDNAEIGGEDTNVSRVNKQQIGGAPGEEGGTMDGVERGQEGADASEERDTEETVRVSYVTVKVEVDDDDVTEGTGSHDDDDVTEGTGSHDHKNDVTMRPTRRFRSGPRDKPYCCEICNGRFAQEHHLEQHLRMHKGEDPFKCSLCEDSFSSARLLASHIKKHPREKRFECDICHRRFSIKGNLKTHMSTHTGEKPYRCTICPKRFAQSSTLVYHMRTHTGEKPYQCEVCGKTFATSSSRLTHLKTHSGEKPYLCPVCNIPFRQPGGLSRHVRIHVDESPNDLEPENN